MSFLRRIWRRWILHRRADGPLIQSIAEKVRPVAKRLNWPAWRIVPLSLSASGDILFAVNCCQTKTNLAIMRFSPGPTPPHFIDAGDGSPDAGLPRHRLFGPEKIQWEAMAYEKLAASDLAPRMLHWDNHLMVNEWCPWERLSNHLRRDRDLVWRFLPVVLHAVNSMHLQSMVHLDLNCGNILIDPNTARVWLIDFEYQPEAASSGLTIQAFDYVRFLHGVMQRRRGGAAIQKDHNRLMKICRDRIPSETRAVMAELPELWLGRCLGIPQFRTQLIDGQGCDSVL